MSYLLNFKIKIYRSFEKFILPVVEKIIRKNSNKYKNIESNPEKYKIGFAILSYERSNYLKVCLSSLYKSKIGGLDITFFIIDDGSKDESIKKIINEHNPENFKVVRVFEKKGPNNAGAAINRAIKLMLKHDNYDLLGWADPDCLFHPDWLIETLQICLWAIKNHKENIIGPFTSFNSSDILLHRIYGKYRSPFGEYVVKRQAGMLNYFMLKSDWDNYGPFEESDSDETKMTNKLSKKFIRNISTNNSYVEHIGQESILNNWRIAKKERAAYGENLIPLGWPIEIENYKNLGYYKNLNKNVSIAEGVSSKLELEVFIPCLEKDLLNLERNIKNIYKYLKHPIKRINIVSPENKLIQDFCKKNDVNFIDELDVLNLKKSELKYIVNNIDRNGWLYQQLLKYSFDLISETENYLVIDADTILTKSQVYENEGKLVLLISDEYHIPYFNNYYKLTGQVPKSKLSSVTHSMLFNKTILNNLKSHIEEYNKLNWIDAIISNIDKNELSGFSEFETYGLWVFDNFSDKYIREYYFNKSLKQSKIELLNKIENEYQKNEIIRSVSFHKYIFNYI
jgi:hypothetical protein